MFSLVIDDLSALKQWRRRLRRVLLKRDLPIVEFRFQQFPPPQNLAFTSLANDLRKACGCASSGFFMSVAAVTTLTLYIRSDDHVSDIGVTDALSFVGIIIAAAATGKLLGVLWARWRLLRLAARIYNKLARANRQPVSESI